MATTHAPGRCPLFVLTLLVLGLAAGAARAQYVLERAYPALSFPAPTDVRPANDGTTYQEFLEGMAKGHIPIGRMGKAEEFARLACFLCSDAGSFITGVAINVDGGASPVV